MNALTFPPPGTGTGTGTRAAVQPAPVHLGGRRAAAFAQARQRLMIGLALFFLATLAIALRLVELAVLRPTAEPVNAAALAGPPRADIVDRNGIELARTFDAYAVAVRPQDVVGDKHHLAAQIAALLPGQTPEKVYAELTHAGSFRYIQRRLLPADARAVNALGDPGIILQREPERLYPNLTLAAHVLGYADVDGRGTYGIEKSLDKRLTGDRNTQVQLSIDARVQQALESELQAAKDKFSAIGAAGIVLDARTGEIIAMTSLPAFNPNAPGHSDDNSRFNRATMGVYELGSTFKAFTVAMGFESGALQGYGDRFDCSHPLHVAKFSINDTHPFHRIATVAEIIKESSNIGTAQIAQRIGADRQRAYLAKLGFMAPVGVELHERGRTLTPGNNWGEIATMTVGYGHGIAVTPLHLAMGYAALANGGIVRAPTLLKVGPGHAPNPGTRVFSEATTAKVRKLLRLVVIDGTGTKADAPGYRIGGKTGTAEKNAGGRYEKHSLVTTFGGVFPMDNPRYVVVAMLDEPKGTKDTFGFATAGWNVAPVVGRVVSRVGPILGVAPDTTRDVDMSDVLPFLQDGGKRHGG